jgi:simple sugar transport system permease protein
VNAFLPVLRSAVIIMTPLLFAATGGLFTELAGMLNIALEGLLLTGAFFAAAALYHTGSFAAGVTAAILASLLLSFILAFTTLRLRSNVFITGLAANLLAGGAVMVFSQRLFNTRGVIVLRDIQRLPRMRVPFAAEIPAAGEIFSGHSLYVYASWLLLLVSWIVIYRTPFGFRLRACARHARALESLGLRPDTYRFAAFLLSGLCCGIGGSFLSLNLGAFVPNMSAGKGWIALVVIFLGGRRPQGLLAAAFVFGLAEAFSNYAQGRFNVPADFILAMPYLFTLIAMIAVSVYARRKDAA